LGSIPKGLFAKEIFLEDLHLDCNKFVGVPNDDMKYLYHLSVLNMSGNLMDRLSENSFDYMSSNQVRFVMCHFHKFFNGILARGDFGAKFKYIRLCGLAKGQLTNFGIFISFLVEFSFVLYVRRHDNFGAKFLGLLLPYWEVKNSNLLCNK
jgi:hypothetical protein